MAFSITLNITDAQEAALTKLAVESARRAEAPEPLSAQAFLQDTLDGMLGTLKEQYFSFRREAIFAALKKAPNATLAQIEATLGL